MSNFHHKNKQFIESVRQTSFDSGFSESLVEKDYYCSLVLKEIFQSKDCDLVFKGGTLLNKCHAGFYRLSEDLDFSISADPNLSRNIRGKLAQKAKRVINQSIKNLSLSFSTPFQGHDENRLYTTTIEYISAVNNDKNTIKIEFGVNEKVLEKQDLFAKTLLKDVLRKEFVLSDFLLPGLSLKEAYSEKIRAALSRKEPAIRDIFDIYYALEKNIIGNSKPKIKSHEILQMLRKKMEDEELKIYLSSSRKEEFLSQLQTDLKPVLRAVDFENFDFEKTWIWLQNIQKELEIL